jgi:RHS repeat-associated protein
VQESNDILNPPPPVRQYSWLWGQVLYTHGLGMDQPLAVHRAGVGVDTLDLSSFAMYPLHDWRGNATAIAFAGGRPLFNGNVQYTPPLPTDENKLLTAYRERTRDSRRVTSWMGSLLTGQMTAMGLEYRRNRYYDPKSGRFTQEDPIGLGGGLNLYGFGGGDPVNYSDPLGLCPPKDKNLADCSWMHEKSIESAGFLDPVAWLSGGISVGIERGLVAAVGANATASAGARVAANKVAGDAFRDEIASAFDGNGYEIAKEVGKKTPFGRRVIDVEVSKDGEVLGGIEAKAGKSRYLPWQRAKDEYLRRSGYPVQVVRDATTVKVSGIPPQ